MLHPLTVKLFSNAPIGIDDTIRNYDKIIRQYLSERAKWLNSKEYITEDIAPVILSAFELKNEKVYPTPQLPDKLDWSHRNSDSILKYPDSFIIGVKEKINELIDYLKTRGI